MDAISLTSQSSVNISRLEQSRSGMSPTKAPQTLAVSNEYGYGTEDDDDINAILYLVANLQPGEVRSYDLNGGDVDNPLSEPTNIGVIKEFAIVHNTENPDGTLTPSDGVTIAIDADLAAAIGLSGAVTFNSKPGSDLKFGYPSGRDVSSTAVITLTNLSASEQTTVVVVAAGFKAVPPQVSGSPMGLLLSLTFA